jgi:thioredoxin-like negative regulator of GroEL
VAVGAAVLLNLALLGTFGWSELLAPELCKGLWVLLGVVWVGSAILSLGWTRRQRIRPSTDAHGDTFSQAVEHYLKGDWFQAQRVLGDLLRSDASDVDARLMLATLLRHTGRLQEAAAELDLLRRFEGAVKWELEIERERELLAEAAKQPLKAAEEKTAALPAEPGYAA